jgi:hypothetical protein
LPPKAAGQLFRGIISATDPKGKSASVHEFADVIARC